MFEKLKALLVRHFTDMRWHSIVLALVVYALSSWLFLFLAQEEGLLQGADFIYWLVVTGSTVGYGDLSPSTEAGKLLVALYIIPVGLSLFALILGRLITWISYQWRKGVKGLKALDVNQHILVIGWNGQRTIQLLNLLLKEKQGSQTQQDIVLCVQADIENPMPGKIKFVKVDSFNQDQAMDKACVADAKVIIIDNPADDMTMTTSLYCHQRNTQSHMLAYFNDESLVKLLQQHCPNIECTPSVAVEMLAKSAFDPGSSTLHHDLISVGDDGQAQYSVELPTLNQELTVGTLFSRLKQEYSATLIAIQSQGKIELNPNSDIKIQKGDKLYYIAKQRLQHINWEQLYAG